MELNNLLAEILGEELLDPRHVGGGNDDVVLSVLLLRPASRNDEAVNVGRLAVSVHLVSVRFTVELAFFLRVGTKQNENKQNNKTRNVDKKGVDKDGAFGIWSVWTRDGTN